MNTIDEIRLRSRETRAMRKMLPYGWTTEGTAEVLFNRDYEVMLARDLDGTNVRKADGHVVDMENAHWIFNDGNPPWHFEGNTAEARRSRIRCEKAVMWFASGGSLEGLENAKES
jgi:hypothetical protein